MKHILGYRCTICGKEFPYTELMTCPDCGEKGILDIVLIMATSKRTPSPAKSWQTAGTTACGATRR